MSWAMPAGYRPMPSQNEFQIDPTNNDHYKAYQSRLLRTDDIQGAQPKEYGNSIPLNAYAGNSSGNTASQKNESYLG